MRYSRSQKVLIYQDDNLSKEFVYDQAFKRIADLNKASFTYRTLYATIIAGYIGALTLLADFSTSSLILPSIEAYTLALHGITLVVFAVTLVICFYDYIFQEIVERSLKAAERIENRSPGFGWGKIALASHRKNSETSLRISLTMFLFYLVPAASLFAIIALTAALVVPIPKSTLNSMVAANMCEAVFGLSALEAKDLETTVTILRINQHISTGLSCGLVEISQELVGSVGDPEVITEVSSGKFSYSFSEPFRRIVGLGYVVAVGFMGYFLFYSLWRILARFFVVLYETELAIYLPRDHILGAFRRTIGWLFTFTIFGVFVGAIFFSQVSQVVVALSLFFL